MTNLSRIKNIEKMMSEKGGGRRFVLLKVARASIHEDACYVVIFYAYEIKSKKRWILKVYSDSNPQYFYICNEYFEHLSKNEIETLVKRWKLYNKKYKND